MKSQQNAQIPSSISQNLLILENRQIVHHMLSVQDWIVLSIYTPNEHQSKPNFSKHKQYSSERQDKHHTVESQESQDLTKLLSVLAIRTEVKQQQQTNINSFESIKYTKPKQSIGEIKMIHKQTRVQNIIHWSSDNKFSKNNMSQQSKNSPQAQPKYFLILSYTKIQLYSVSQTQPSSITLSQVFSTPFLIPFNIINLKNPKLQQQKQQQQNNPISQKDKANRLIFNQVGQKYKIGMVGIDRSQTFWSGYYEIETSKRNLYLFSEFVIKPRQATTQRQNPHQTQISDRNSPPRTLRRVRSAENVFQTSNKSIYLQEQSPQKMKKEQLSSTQLNPRADQLTYSTSNALKGQNQRDVMKRQYRSPQSTQYTQVSTEQSESMNSDKKNVNRLRQFRQPELLIPKQSRTQKRPIKQQSAQPKKFPIQLKPSKKLQLSPSLTFSSKQTSPQQSPHKKPLPHSPKSLARQLFSYNHGSTKCYPPIEHIHLFYSQTLVSIKVQFRGGHKQVESPSKKRYRRGVELMVLVGYWNVVVLVNVERQETVSRVDLDANVVVSRTLAIPSLFGIFSAMFLTKCIASKTTQQSSQHVNATSHASQEYSDRRKLIQVSIDSINHEQLGMGLEPVKLPCLSPQQQVTQCQSIWNPNLPHEIHHFLQSYRLQLTYQNQQQIKLKQSYDEVMMDLIDELGNDGSQELQQKDNERKFRDSVKNDPQMRDYIKEEDEGELALVRVRGQLDVWMGVRVRELEYCVVVTTTKQRIILYNHLKGNAVVLYDPAVIRANQIKISQSESQEYNKPHAITSIHAINRVSVSPLHIQKPINTTINNHSPKLCAKIALLFSTDIKNFIAKCNNSNNNNSNSKYNNTSETSTNQQLPISLIKELKQIRF